MTLNIDKDCEHGVGHECDGEMYSYRTCRSVPTTCLCQAHLVEKIEAAVEKATENEYLIWSFEHDAWWKPRENGYTTDRRAAGAYSYKDALTIVLGANINFNDAQGDPDRMPNEAMVPLKTT